MLLGDKLENMFYSLDWFTREYNTIPMTLKKDKAGYTIAKMVKTPIIKKFISKWPIVTPEIIAEVRDANKDDAEIKLYNKALRYWHELGMTPAFINDHQNYENVSNPLLSEIYTIALDKAKKLGFDEIRFDKHVTGINNGTVNLIGKNHNNVERILGTGGFTSNGLTMDKRLILEKFIQF